MMADKDFTLEVGAVASLQIKPTFEGKTFALNKISVDSDASDLKGLVTIGALVDGGAGVVDVPLTGVLEGTQEATVVFKYADAGVNSDVEGYGKSTKTIALTITAAAPLARLIDVTTPLTMDLWESKPLTFKVVKGEGEAENDISNTITGVSVDPDAIMDKFEFSGVVGEGNFAFKSIASSTTEVVTATAKLLVVGNHDGVDYTLRADVVLNTNINDGSIPTNRFDVQFVQ
ncbi:hypothetical protein OBP_204 [Pseudomonas phage OBP]|uniref:hypothetical protein n=1 Tax=Pseudomonas phage OBP TaxID=1124849 RepID=UPI000240D5AC|nr:hypothetical protein OBP_204 [Pseudomonas phage OBP]AEV89641.1 hypothetical protein OBP_204 [Pseudomonas phage OBP]